MKTIYGQSETKYKQISMSIGMKYSKYFTLLLAEDGTVWSTGSNFFGQLGTGDRNDRLNLAQAKNLRSIMAVEAGNLHSVVLTQDGVVMGFGLSINGCLGSLPLGPNPIARPIPELIDVNVIQIAAAGDTTFALASDHTLYILDNGVKTLTEVKNIYAGANESYIKKLDGSFLCFKSAKEPIPVDELSTVNVRHIAMGNTHMAVLTQEGTVLCRGDNSNGQIGLVDAEQSEIFVDVGLTGITCIAAGGSHTLALNNRNEVYAWGFNFFGQLGDGTGQRCLTAQKVQGLPPVAYISAGTFNSMVLTTNNEVYGWGSDDFGQLGDGTHSLVKTPRKIDGISNVSKACGGLYHTVALTESGTLYIVGCNLYGQLGDKKNDIGRCEFQPLLHGITDVEAGGTHTLAMDMSGRIHAWGNNACGQLGNGSTDVNPDLKLGGGEYRNVSEPIVIDIPPMQKMAAGENHTLFLDKAGDVYAVGLNNCGQLGDGTRHNTSTPEKVSGLKDICEIHAHKFRSAALDKNGNLYCWGYNASGELGTGDILPRLVPHLVMENVANVIMGGWYTLAIKRDSTVWAFGMNADGQFGDKTNKGSLLPKEVTPFYEGFKSIVAGGFHTVVLKHDGTVWTCGKNEFGELGSGPSMSRNTLSPVPGLDNIVRISAGWFSVFAISNTGQLSVFGRNNFGQLCHPDTNRYYPVKMK